MYSFTLIICLSKYVC